MNKNNKMKLFCLAIIAMLAVVGSVAVIADADHSDAAGTVYEIHSETSDYSVVGQDYAVNSGAITSSSNGGQFLKASYSYTVNWVCVSSSSYPTSNNGVTALSGISAFGAVVSSTTYDVNMSLSGTPTASGDWRATMSVTYTKTSDSTTTTVLYGLHWHIDSGYTYYSSLYYNTNGGTSTPSTSSQYIISSSAGATGSYTHTVPSYSGTKTGYTFLGWSTSSTATTATYTAGSTITINYGSSDTLYAVWTANTNTYYAYLYYDGNGGVTSATNDYATMTGTAASGSHDFTVTGSTAMILGHTFLGWSTSSTATTATYTAGSTVSVPFGSSVTLYAIFSADTTTSYSISFNGNGGTGTAANLSGIYGSTVILPSSGFTRTGYVLSGWSTSYISGAGTVHDLGSSYTITSTTTLFAVWTVTYTVTFNTSGGTEIDSQTIVSGDLVTEPDEPTREGYTFAGWFTDASCTDGNQFDFETTAITDTTTLYSLWYRSTAPVASFTYTVDGLLVIFTDTSVAADSWQWSFGNTSTSMSQNPAYTYTEIGSYTVTLTISNSYNGGTTDTYTATVPITNATVKYAVIFDSDGGTSVDAITVISGQTITKPADPTILGGIFCGWYDLSVSGEETFDFSTPITANTTLTAAWVQGETPVVTSDTVAIYVVAIFAVIGVLCLLGTVRIPILGVIGIFDLIACALIYFLVL